MFNPHIPWSNSLVISKNNRKIQYTLFLALILVLSTILSSCSSSANSFVIPLSQMQIEDKRFLDTLEESTTFYFDLFNFDGYDRFGGTIFEDLKYRLSSRSSIKTPNIKIALFEGAINRKGLHTKYAVYGVYKNEPELTKKIESSLTAPINGDIDLKQVLVPASVKLLIASKDLSSNRPLNNLRGENQIMGSAINSAPEKRDMRLIIIACFKESYFQESMILEFENDLSNIDYYRAKGWVRVYLTDIPGYRIDEAQEVFPDAWRANIGE